MSTDTDPLAGLTALADAWATSRAGGAIGPILHDAADELRDTITEAAKSLAAREAKAEAWDEGHLEDCFDDPTRCANRHLAANPYRELFPETVEREEK